MKSKNHQEFKNNKIIPKQTSFLKRREELRSRSFHTISCDVHVCKLKRLDPNETTVMWVHIKDKKHSENITSSVSKYASRTELPKSPTLGQLLFAIFISDPDDRTQTTFIKLTNNQLGGTANYTEGQKDKLEKGLRKKMKGKALHISRSSQLENNRAVNDWLRRSFI